MPPVRDRRAAVWGDQLVKIWDRMEKWLEDRVEERVDERVVSEAQNEVWGQVWTKVGVRFWTFDPFMEVINL